MAKNSIRKPQRILVKKERGSSRHLRGFISLISFEMSTTEIAPLKTIANEKVLKYFRFALSIINVWKIKQKNKIETYKK